MFKSTIISIIASAVFLSVIALDVFDFNKLSSALELSLVSFITLTYLFLSKNKSKLLICFFTLYSIADIISVFDLEVYSNWAYYVCNTIYITAYLFLILYITQSLSFKLIFKRSLLDFIVLFVLDMYMIYVLIDIIKPIDFASDFDGIVQIVELFYSSILILILSLSFLNYVQNANKKHLLLFISCVLIAFSELILIGYYYIVDDIRISYLSTILFVSGIFTLFYHTMKESNIEDKYI